MTEQQHRVFILVRDAIATTGVCPSFDEIATAMKLKSKSNVVRIVDALCRDGHLARGPRGTNRNLRVVGTELTHVRTSALIGELERRGVTLG